MLDTSFTGDCLLGQKMRVMNFSPEQPNFDVFLRPPVDYYFSQKKNIYENKVNFEQKNTIAWIKEMFTCFNEMLIKFEKR